MERIWTDLDLNLYLYLYLQFSHSCDIYSHRGYSDLNVNFKIEKAVFCVNPQTVFISKIMLARKILDVKESVCTSGPYLEIFKMGISSTSYQSG